MRKWLIMAAAGLMALGAGWYFLSPSMAMSSLRSAALEGDKDELTERIDFPAIRQSLKDQFNAHLMAEMAKKKNDGFAGLGAAMAAAMVGPMIDGMITPDGMKTMVKAGKFPKPGDAVGPANDPDLKWAVSRKGFDKFTATPQGKNGQKVPTLVFKRDGFSWKLTDIEIPSEGIGSSD